jgi:hypothetical protein
VVVTSTTGVSITATQRHTWIDRVQFGLPSEGNFVVQAHDQPVLAGATGMFVTA